MVYLCSYELKNDLANFYGPDKFNFSPKLARHFHMKYLGRVEAVVHCVKHSNSETFERKKKKKKKKKR